MDDITRTDQEYSQEDNPIQNKNGYEYTHVMKVYNQWIDAEVSLIIPSSIYWHYNPWECVQLWK